MALPSGLTPEQRARQNIDAALRESGWVIQDRNDKLRKAGT
jgi:type I site-specific restriction endonuclease